MTRSETNAFYIDLSILSVLYCVYDFIYAPQLYPQVLLRRVLAMGILYVRLSVCLPVCLSVTNGGIPSTGEIETPGVHHMIA